MFCSREPTDFPLAADVGEEWSAVIELLQPPYHDVFYPFGLASKRAVSGERSFDPAANLWWQADGTKHLTLHAAAMHHL